MTGTELSKKLMGMVTERSQTRRVPGSCGVGCMWPNSVIRPAVEIQIAETTDERGHFVATLATVDDAKFTEAFGSIHAKPWNDCEA